MKKKLIYLLFLLSVKLTAQEQFSLYFESNKFEPDARQKTLLYKWVAENANSKIVAINGYTDEDGSTGFNDTLAKKRVASVFNLIKDKVKIREDFKTRSFGENHNLSSVKSENRKVTVYYILQKDLAREDEILGIKVAPVEKPKPKPIKYPTSLITKNPDGSTAEIKLDTVFMQKINRAKIGEKLIIENLNFKINTFIVEQQSVPKMFELLTVLQKNPNLKIKINGHLCCMPSDKQDLSTKRAKAIYGFLTAYEIDKNRLSYKGYGISDPIYPIPEKEEAQRAANRRVEIEIVEN